VGQAYRIVLGCSVALAAVIALSWAVGYAGRGPGFDWDLASVFGTALGTTLLALATGALALLTYREVSATQELAELTRRDQQMRERPLVLATVTQLNGLNSDETWLSVEMVNVGLGPAVRIELGATYSGPGEAPDIPLASGLLSRPAAKWDLGSDCSLPPCQPSQSWPAISPQPAHTWTVHWTTRSRSSSAVKLGRTTQPGPSEARPEVADR
jgi:hypothetical protein